MPSRKRIAHRHVRQPQGDLGSLRAHYPSVLTFLPLTDLSLLHRAREGDKAALAALVERRYSALLASCRRMLHDPDLARDAAQEAVLRAMLGLEQLRDD